MSKQKNVKNLIMSVLPDNRPITSLQIVEDYEKCPKNFVPVHRTHDQDADADLWRETNILFGKRTSRYLCLSKSEGLPDYIVETLKVCGDRELPGEGFSLLSRTADSEHKAWRKRQIAYKLAKRGTITHAVTDVILCSKLKAPPDGFKLAGEINGITVCYKSGPVTHRPPPSIPAVDQSIKDLESSLHYINIASPTNGNVIASNKPKAADNDYEIIRASYQLSPPGRQAPKPPAPVPLRQNGTLPHHSEMDGVPFIFNSSIAMQPSEAFDIRRFNFASKAASACHLEYDFQLERQILCTTKTPNSKNPFFACQ